MSGFVYQKKFSEEEWEEISQEMPKEDDGFLRKYIDGRENLIEQENKQRSGSGHLSCVESSERDHAIDELIGFLLSRCIVQTEPIPDRQEGMRHSRPDQGRGEQDDMDAAARGFTSPRAGEYHCVSRDDVLAI